MKLARNALLPAMAVSMIAISHAVFGQVSLTPNRGPFLTTDQLIAVMGDETTAAAIVSQALGEFLRWRRLDPNVSKTVIGSQIPVSWLPLVTNVEFFRLTDAEARTHLQQCGRLLFVNSFSLTGGVVDIAVADGNRCSIGGLDLRFDRAADGWRLQTGGVPGGFVSGQSGCPCK